MDCVKRVKKKEKQGLGKFGIEWKCETLPFFLFCSYELKMSAYILLRNTLVVSFFGVAIIFCKQGSKAECDNIVGRSVLDYQQKIQKELGPEIQPLPEGQHFNEFCINLKYDPENKTKKMSNCRSINQTSLLETVCTSVHNSTYPCLFFYFSDGSNVNIFPLYIPVYCEV